MTRALLGCLICLASASPTLALGCLYKREQISGSNKTCFCECLTGEAAITVNAVRSCPVEDR